MGSSCRKPGTCPWVFILRKCSAGGEVRALECVQACVWHRKVQGRVGGHPSAPQPCWWLEGSTVDRFQAASSWVVNLVPGRAGAGHWGTRRFLTGQAGESEAQTSCPAQCGGLLIWKGWWRRVSGKQYTPQGHVAKACSDLRAFLATMRLTWGMFA